MTIYGWTGKVLRIDLTKLTSSVEDLNRKAAEQYIGGRGLGAKYLYDEIDPMVDPLSPANKLLFVTGPLTGTAYPGGNRYVVVTKSPLTGGIANSSAAGDFATHLKYAGYDMIIVEGKATRPVYLYIDDDTISFGDAKPFWGMDTEETERALIAATTPDAKVACIGPAGEHLVRYACIMNDMGRAAGRSGVGAVMGSKNLKAIAVHGTKGVRVADNVRFQEEMVSAYQRLLDPANTWREGYYMYGTSNTVELSAVCGVLPTKNFQLGINPEYEKLTAEPLAVNLSVRKRAGVACPACPLACGRITRVKNPEFAGIGAGPEYETIGQFGSNCYTNDLEAVSKANFICNQMGMDTITTGATIASAMEMYERGIISESDIGFPLPFGDSKAMVKLTEMIAKREGIGDLLAEGSHRLGEHYGTTEYFMGVKKQEFSAYDSRGLQGMALGFATQPRGACHIRGEVHNLDIFEVTCWRITRDRGLDSVDPLTWEDKPALAKDTQDWFCMIDSCGLCNFMSVMVPVDEDQMLVILEVATGIHMGGFEGLMRTGDRIFNIETLFNRRAGLTSKDDTLPRRLLEDPMTDGPAKGHVAELAKMLPPYYKLRGWDEEGNLSPEKAAELDLEVLQKA